MFEHHHFNFFQFRQFAPKRPFFKYNTTLTKIFLTQFLTSYRGWAKGEPNNAGGDENCVHLYTTKDKDWNDIKCYNQYSYICQQVCRETNSLSVAVNLFTIDHNNNNNNNNNNVLRLVPLLSSFPTEGHVIGVCLPSQSASKKRNQEKKAHIALRTLCISQR